MKLKLSQGVWNSSGASRTYSLGSGLANKCISIKLLKYHLLPGLPLFHFMGCSC